MILGMNETEMAEQLNTYIDLGADAVEDEKRPPDAPVVDALRASVAAVEPSPAFVARLSNHLRQRRTTIAPPPRLFTLPRVLWTGVAVALVLLLAVTKMSGNKLAITEMIGNDKSDLLLLPRLVYASENTFQDVSGGLLGGEALVLAMDLSDAPAEMTVYRAAPAHIPSTPEEALIWARDFGLPAPQVYQDASRPDSLIVRGSDDEQLEFYNSGSVGMIYYSNDSVIVTDTHPLPFDRAAEIAVAFLDEHHLLPETYQVVDDEQPEVVPVSGYVPSPIRSVQIVREIDGRPLVGPQVNFHVSVAPDGQITFVSFRPFTYERDLDYPIKSAEEVYAALTNGHFFRLSVSETSPPESPTSSKRQYQSPPITYTIDEPVHIIGSLTLQVSQDDAPPRIQLNSEGITYKLVDVPRQSELLDGSNDPVRIEGVITGQLGQRHWQIAVTDWERVSPRDAPWLYGITKCFVGTFTRGTDRAELITGRGERYGILNPPQDLVEGEYISLYTDLNPAPNDDVRSWIISVPPDDLCIDDDDNNADEEILSAERICSAFPSEPSGDLEQSVVLTGVVDARIFLTNDEKLYDVYLREQYPLAGTEDVLEAITQYNYLHIRLWGRILLPAESPSPGEPTVVVECFEKLWPEENLRVFLGHTTLETLEGKDVVIFTDIETDQRYVLESDLYDPVNDYALTLQHEGQWSQECVAGTVHPVRTYADLPILNVYDQSRGLAVEIASTSDECRLRLGSLVIERPALPLFEPPARVTPVATPGSQPGSSPSQEQGQDSSQSARSPLIVDRAELAYYYQDSPLYDNSFFQPVWVFYGHSEDNMLHFTAYVQAVTEEYIENTAH